MSMSYEIIENHWGIDENLDRRWILSSKSDLFNVIEPEIQDDMEIDFVPLFEKILSNNELTYEDKVSVLKNLWYLLDSNTQGLRSEEILFLDDLKTTLLAIWHNRVSDQVVIEDAFQQVLYIVESIPL
jgi:hypothetical protein